MRPRVFPAEDAASAEKRERERLASMRPRVFPAEDEEGVSSEGGSPSVASMRPRVFPAEDLLPWS